MTASAELQPGPGAQSAGQHTTKAGAAASEVHRRFGGHEDPPTVAAAETQRPVQEQHQNGHAGVGQGPQTAGNLRDAKVLCGPLLNYRHMSKANTDSPVWHGSVLLVTTPSQQPPKLTLRVVRRREQDEILTGAASKISTLTAEPLYHDPNSSFWRFAVDVPFQAFETNWEYSISGLTTESRTFVVPSKDESFRIMFHSCNVGASFFGSGRPRLTLSSGLLCWYGRRCLVRTSAVE